MLIRDTLKDIHESKLSEKSSISDSQFSILQLQMCNFFCTLEAAVLQHIAFFYWEQSLNQNMAFRSSSFIKKWLNTKMHDGSYCRFFFSFPVKANFIFSNFTAKTYLCLAFIPSSNSFEHFSLRVKVPKKPYTAYREQWTCTPLKLSGEEHKCLGTAYHFEVSSYFDNSTCKHAHGLSFGSLSAFSLPHTNWDLPF